MRHTPGPWVNQGETIRGSNEDAVCDLYDWIERDANAQLIAAAPDMLNALREACSMIEHVLDDGYVYEGGRELLASVLDAIAKAEGKTQ